MSFIEALGAGICAGLAVDFSLFPIDTLKTRLQAKGGFLKNGKFKGLYRGIGSIFVGSAPGASLFFTTYETSKKKLSRSKLGLSDPVVHMISASLGEIVACTVRVPTEVIKQKAQASAGSLSSKNVFKSVISSAQGWKSLYSGFSITIAREIPFTLIQYPLWEYLKAQYCNSHKVDVAPSYQAALYGSVAGGVAAALTTPMDVLKTRMMLAHGEKTYFQTVSEILRHEGFTAFWRGLVPRVCWLSCGGAIFLGAYDVVYKVIQRLE
ncbi:S-adenosylmethionine transporter [Schizosaccharomyces japonicus yFS275]|uniref:S-adenosylmethionine transporter n=1 Tax=Schizosaccharomyces japonicus (strain yFS275 / FY16936) TaxID=402676 RepID=B6JZ66_SCHJY|nr:S-adenosylmethionine transporter [Schizosaccharomyces japonicus yFS275]EEB06834.1 S-adenosylmethionine transporter [Schizosaccharomyces japonicus yFS275]